MRKLTRQVLMVFKKVNKILSNLGKAAAYPTKR